MEFIGQKQQDRWVIEEVFPGKRGGYFVDLAATDGLAINNTLLLERDLGWSGLAIEPNPEYFQSLRANRSCACLDTCIDEQDGKTVRFLPNAELGGIVDADTDNSPTVRAALIEEWRDKMVTFTTKTLASVLDDVGAPSVIDYLSLDVEGAETRILRTFPFSRYTFLALTIERPTPEINATLFSNGYVFVRNNSFDSFYVHSSLAGIDVVKKDPFEQIPAKDW